MAKVQVSEEVPYREESACILLHGRPI